MTTSKTFSKVPEPDLETICRLCLQPDTGSINIFQSQLSIPVRIMACAALEVRIGDGLPCLICEKCRYQLEVSYYFRKKCQISDGKLRKHIRLLNAGKKSRVFIKSNDDDDEPDEEELQCEESIKFIEVEDERKKAEEDDKKRQWLEEQREQFRKEDTQRLFEEFGMFMQSRMPVEKSVKKGRASTPSPATPPSRHPHPQQKEQLQEVQTVYSKRVSAAKEHQEEQQQQQNREEPPQSEGDADNEITSSEQIPDEQEEQHVHEQQEQEESMFYSDDCGEVENSEMLIFDGKSNDEDDGDNEIIQVEGDEDTEMVDHMNHEEEGVGEDGNDENEMENKANNDTEEMDEFIFLAEFEDSNHVGGQVEQATEVESYQIEENGDIQYLKDEGSQEDAINSNHLDNSSDANTKYVIEDVTIMNKYEERVPAKLEKKRKQRKLQIPVINKVVTLVNDKVSSNDLKIFKCSECPQSFTRANSLLRHRSAHKGGRDYCCDYCDKYFSCKSSLDRHIRIHTGEKPFTCDQCGKNFMQKEILKRHVTIHTGERPHQCPHCSRSFVQKLLMNQHINAVHLAVPQITKNVCHLCPKSFLHPSGLSRHLLTHKGMLFSCPVCGRAFNDKSSLRRHFAAVHMKNEQIVVPKAEPDEIESSNEYLLS